MGYINNASLGDIIMAGLSNKKIFVGIKPGKEWANEGIIIKGWYFINFKCFYFLALWEVFYIGFIIIFKPGV